MKACLWAILLFSTNLIADPRICVRNYATEGADLCEFGTSTRHKYVVNEPNAKRVICSVIYDDEKCKFYKQEFAHAITPEGEIVCVLNQNQPGIGSNACASQPDSYSYVLDPWI